MAREDELAREEIEETGENPTQRRIGEGEPSPVDVGGWTDNKPESSETEPAFENEPTQHEGEEGTDPAA